MTVRATSIGREIVHGSKSVHADIKEIATILPTCFRRFHHPGNIFALLIQGTEKGGGRAVIEGGAHVCDQFLIRFFRQLCLCRKMDGVCLVCFIRVQPGRKTLAVFKGETGDLYGTFFLGWRDQCRPGA